jgi:hypothetical protein
MKYRSLEFPLVRVRTNILHQMKGVLVLLNGIFFVAFYTQFVSINFLAKNVCRNHLSTFSRQAGHLPAIPGWSRQVAHQQTCQSLRELWHRPIA